MFVQKPDDEKVLEYVKKNFTKMVRFAIDNNDVETISEVCKRKDLLTKRNIDNLIEYTIQHTQNGGIVEIQGPKISRPPTPSNLTLSGFLTTFPPRTKSESSIRLSN